MALGRRQLSRTQVSPVRTLWVRSEGRRGGDSAWTYLELQASRTLVAFRLPSARPQPLQFPCALCTPSHTHHELEAAKGGCWLLSRRCPQLRWQVSPALAPLPGQRAGRSWARRGPDSPGPDGHCQEGLERQVPQLWAHCRRLSALPGLEARGSRALDAGAGRTDVPSRCGAPSSLLPPRASEARAWVRLPPPLPFRG